MNKVARFSFILSIGAFITCVTYLFYPPLTPLSPLGIAREQHDQDATGSRKYIILGFAPYWNMKKLTAEALDTISHFAYFALHLNNDGTLYTHVNRREQDPGYTNYQRILNNPPTANPLILTFMPIDQDALQSILTNPTYRRKAIQTVSEAVSASGATGVNVDFEPLGDSSIYRENFTQFIAELRKTLSGKQLSISMYPSAASRVRIWDLPKLAPLTDYFVVMTYDYTLPGDNKTGPNSPLRGAGTLFQHDITKNLAEITEFVPSEKILLGVPFYGYEWNTTETEKYTPTTKRGSVASLERIEELARENTLELLWDRNSLTPYAIRRENGEVVSQIYYENANSIQLKLELVKQANLGGIAIWALGYEGNNTALWAAIRKGLTSTK